VKVAQVVTYVSEDGAFGGPVSVALSQAVECARKGHDVTLIGGWDGRATVDAPGVEVKLFRTRQVLPRRLTSFAGLVAPGLQRYVRRHANEFDVLHFQLSRDLITLPAAAAAVRGGHPGVVTQAHGMIVPDARLRARLFDAVAVRRVLSGSGAVLAYSGVDDDQISAVARGDLRLFHLHNGVTPAPPRARGFKEFRDVVFMARLHPRKRVMDFVHAARNLIADGATYRFSIVGPDEGDLPKLQQFVAANGLGQTIRYEGPLAPGQVRARLSEADLYVLPSWNEPFPVTVLDALAVGTPTIITDSCGIADLLEPAGAARVTDGSVASLTAAIRDLASDPDLRAAASRAGVSYVNDQLAISSVVDELISVYEGVVTASR